MTKEEILSAISGTIEGQGNQVDVGGKLADVLKGIVDLIPEDDVVTIALVSLSDGDESEEAVLDRIEINDKNPTKEQLIELAQSNKVISLGYTRGDQFIKCSLTSIILDQQDEENPDIAFHFGCTTNGFGGWGCEVLINLSGNNSSVKWNEI